MRPAPASSESESVVLPWSMWAAVPMLRTCLRSDISAWTRAMFSSFLPTGITYADRTRFQQLGIKRLPCTGGHALDFLALGHGVRLELPLRGVEDLVGHALGEALLVLVRALDG